MRRSSSFNMRVLERTRGVIVSDIILEMRNISKSFPGVKALKNVNFSVRRGEIHCLVGENGAGKSTLMKVLSGIYKHGSYEGDIVYNDKIMEFRSIKDSENQGIAIINQELALIPELTVAENIFFGHELMKNSLIDWNETMVQSKEYLNKVRLDINPKTKIRDLRVGKQQLVEIAKALSKNAKLMILDEPTSSLNEEDSANLLELLRELKQQDVTIIMISHRLMEVVAIADTVTVLRDGSTICSIKAEEREITESEIIKHMVGREMDHIYPKREHHEIGDVCFEVKNWSVYDSKLDREIIHDLNLEVRKGEIVGLAGLMGAGRTEFALSIFGNTPGYHITSGQIVMNHNPVRFKTPNDAIKAGVAYATEDRKRNGLVMIQDVRFNTTFANLKSLVSHHVINQNEEIIQTEKLRKDINIKTPSIQQTVMNLSGGNQQKVVLAKWIFANPNLMILDEPTRGIDVGAKYEIYTLMNDMVRQGMSIIMISSELLEILGMSDRIYVMCEGKITGELQAGEATEQNIMRLATNMEDM
ncbi:MAG: sugar ABC transporter ATP-binding protein [Christensenella sp.]|nr:sugar ABC transporter ATP-binding protein [Christensenella sp.]